MPSSNTPQSSSKYIMMTFIISTSDVMGIGIAPSDVFDGSNFLSGKDQIDAVVEEVGNVKIELVEKGRFDGNL